MMLAQYMFDSLEDTLSNTGSDPVVMKWWIALYLGWVVVCGLVGLAVRWLCLPLSQTDSIKQMALQSVSD
jgi:hypothetical protein